MQDHSKIVEKVGPEGNTRLEYVEPSNLTATRYRESPAAAGTLTVEHEAKNQSASICRKQKHLLFVTSWKIASPKPFQGKRVAHQRK